MRTPLGTNEKPPLLPGNQQMLRYFPSPLRSCMVMQRILWLCTSCLRAGGCYRRSSLLSLYCAQAKLCVVFQRMIAPFMWAQIDCSPLLKARKHLFGCFFFLETAGLGLGKTLWWNETDPGCANLMMQTKSAAAFGKSSRIALFPLSLHMF